MKSKSLSFLDGFRIVLRNSRSQAAEMVLPPGHSVGGPDNRHPASDQWLYVVSGHGEAVVGNKIIPLSTQTLVLIEQGEGHEIRNMGKDTLRTVSFYVPPAYRNGD